MNPFPKNITEFLNENKIATICFVDNENNPYCINCFYTFDESNQALVLKSSHGTTHQSFIKADKSIAGTILPNSIDFLKIKGIQFTGKLLDDKQISTLGLSLKYTKKYPMSLAIPGYVWAIKFEFIKLTDNTLGFGNKTVWKNDK